MHKQYYLLSAVVLFAVAVLSALVVRKTEVGSTQRFILEKVVSNAALLSAFMLFVLWLFQLIRS